MSRHSVKKIAQLAGDLGRATLTLESMQGQMQHMQEEAKAKTGQLEALREEMEGLRKQAATPNPEQGAELARYKRLAERSQEAITGLRNENARLRDEIVLAKTPVPPPLPARRAPAMAYPPPPPLEPAPMPTPKPAPKPAPEPEG